MSNLITFEELKQVLSFEFERNISDKHLEFEGNYVMLHLPNEVVTVAKDIRSEETSLGFKILI